MTPQREWLKKGEIIILIDERVQPLITQLRETQRQNHEENKGTLREIKQQNDTQLARLSGRDDAIRGLFVKATKVLAWITSPATIYGAINLIRHLYLWFMTGRFFPVTH